MPHGYLRPPDVRELVEWNSRRLGVDGKGGHTRKTKIMREVRRRFIRVNKSDKRVSAVDSIGLGRGQ